MCPRNKERSPETVDKTGGANASSERAKLYWLRFAYATLRCIQRPFDWIVWGLQQRINHLDVAIMTRDQADD
jgi:hypothetical protein